MRKRHVVLTSLVIAAVVTALASYPSAQAQAGADVKALYDRADSFGRRAPQTLVRNVADNPQWVDGSARLTYRRSVKGGFEFMLADIAAKTKAPAFDHAKLATALSSAASASYTAVTLPFQTFTFADNKSAIEFSIGGGGGGRQGGGGGGRQGGGAPASGTPPVPRYRCTLTDYTCTRLPAPAEAPQAGGGQGAGGRQGGGRQGGGATNVGQMGGAAAAAPSDDAKNQPGGGCWQAMINNFNVYLRPIPAATAPPNCRGQQSTPLFLSVDGSDGDYYSYGSMNWSPDGKKIVAVRTRPGYDRDIHYVQSSPTDQVQPKLLTVNYQKPGDLRAMTVPVIFDIATKRPLATDTSLFANPYQNSNPQWRPDSSAVTFNYNQRGHQIYRIIEINATTGKSRAIIEEKSAGFIDYSAPAPGLSGGRTYQSQINDGKEIIWMSERDGWAHLYLYDGTTGQVKNQITKGEWAVHNVDRVDVPNRQIWFYANGMDAGKDPYFFHLFRVNFDGTGLTRFTTGDGTHSIPTGGWSPDRTYYIDTYSRVNMPQVTEIRKTSDQSLAFDLEHGDMTDLLATGWSAPEVFTAKGRDGKTDIWGIIIKPTNFDATKKYPVIENIYAGPQGSFVPKTFSNQAGMNALAEFGFIVVQVDGMGTANRSRDFHEMSFKNIGDAGFPDRILWHKAIAAKYSWYDATRVGIYGTSAGGQNAAGAVFTHPEFYDVAVSNSGCHDNRMDKIWWNEQWMSWPIGPEYAQSSNVTHAANLKGAIQLVVPELDTNVDPASTMQVVNALVQARKEFELVVIPGANHGAASPITARKRNDFFVKNLLGLVPPNWNDMPVNTTTGDDNPFYDPIDYEALERDQFFPELYPSPYQIIR